MGRSRGGKREIVVQDPDGYLVMLAEDLGERPLGEDHPALVIPNPGKLR